MLEDNGCAESVVVDGELETSPPDGGGWGAAEKEPMEADEWEDKEEEEEEDDEDRDEDGNDVIAEPSLCFELANTAACSDVFGNGAVFNNNDDDDDEDSEVVGLAFLFVKLGRAVWSETLLPDCDGAEEDGAEGEWEEGVDVVVADDEDVEDEGGLPWELGELDFGAGEERGEIDIEEKLWCCDGSKEEEESDGKYIMGWPSLSSSDDDVLDWLSTMTTAAADASE
jgi:hypothetical protein